MNALVIGGSAGAFAALEAILSRLAPDCAVPIIVVQHLHADDDGLFAEHLGRTSALPVVEAEDKTPLMPGRVHVAPAGYHLLVEDAATLALSVDPPVNWSRPAIDVLFESAARVWGADLVAVLLSGANADGTAGLSAVKAAGGHMMRGGAFKPRTSPYAFQGLGEEGLKMLAAARDETGLPIVTEVMDPRDLELVADYADVLQVGARNTQNFLLLAELGRLGRPVLLKRGASTTIEELLMSAEYMVKEGNRDVILCERGIRTFETATRNTFDVSAVPVIKLASHLPVVVDPSHSAGRLDLVPALSLAGVAAGADGVLVETHPNPEYALCDGPQSLPTAGFAEYAGHVLDLARYMGKSVA